MARPLPITLVAGFLGAGKTSLLHHLISEHGGGHLAVLVETEGELNLDAKALRGLCGAMRRNFDVVEEFGSTDDLVGALNEITQGARHERALVEVSGLTQAAYWVRKLRESGTIAQIENVVVVVDLLDFHREFVASSAPVKWLAYPCSSLGSAKRSEAKQTVTKPRARESPQASRRALRSTGAGVMVECSPAVTLVARIA